MQKKLNRGYSLIELSISLTVLALLVTSGMTLFAKKSEAEKVNITKAKIRRIEKAIVDFVDTNSYIPCPAKGVAVESDAYFGDSITNASYNSNTHLCSNNTTNNAGMIPVRTLGLDDSYAYDGWDRKFSYQIAKGMGNAYDFSDPNYRGDISIVDYYGIERTNTKFFAPKNYGAAFVIISFGSDGIGAWGKNSSTTPTPPNASAIAYQNSKYLTTSNNIYIQDSTRKNFDDIVSFKNKLFITSSRLSTSPIKVSNSLCNDANSIVTSGFANGGKMSASITGTVPTATASQDLNTQIYLSAVKLQKLCNSPPLTATITDSAITACYFNPTSITGLQLWLDANDLNADGSSVTSGTINTWRDKRQYINVTSSGTGAKVVNANIFPNNNYPLYFDGTNYYNNINLPLSGNYTIFVVEASSGNTAINNTILNSTTANCPILKYDYQPNSAYNNSDTIINYNSFYYYFQNNSTIASAPAEGLVPVTPNLWVASFNNPNQTLNVYSANGAVASSSQTSTTCSSIGNLTIGNTYKGYIAEILIYNESLSQSDINAIQGYLAVKWLSGECI